MTPEQIEIERKKFEAWQRKHVIVDDCFLEQEDGCYTNRDTYKSWKGWLACCESRESVCVVLPDSSMHYDNYSRRMIPYFRKQSVESMLQSSGIFYREEE